MKGRLPVIAVSALFLVWTATNAAAQQPGTQTEGGTATQSERGPGMMGPGEMMGPSGMMGRGMMGGAAARGEMPAPLMRIIFALIDTDSDGKISLQEFQAAHERIFKAMDANNDGQVTLEEMETFFRGTR